MCSWSCASKLARKISVDRFSPSLFSLTWHGSLNGWKKLLPVFIALLLISSCKKDKEEPQKVTSIAVTPSSSALTAGGTQQLKAVVTPADAANQEVTWSSSDPAVATVNAAGLVTGLTEGKATVTAAAKDGSDVKGTATVTVTLKKVTSITVTSSSTAVAVGSTQQLTAAVLPEDAADKGVTWSSSDISKATVDPSTGLVSGLSTGAVTITAAAKDGSGITGAVELTVTQRAISIAITPAEPSAVGVNKTLALTATVLPSTALQTVMWTSSLPNIAAVSSAGVVTGVARGTAGITVAAADR